MTEKELLSKIKQLRRIKPREEWVVFVKNRILEEEFEKETEKRIISSPFSVKEFLTGLRIIFQHKLVFASLVLLFVFVGVFGFAQKSVPGDFLYLVKKAAENSQKPFLSSDEKPKFNIKIANRRLEDVLRVSKEKSGDNLASAISEYQMSVSEVTESLAKAEKSKNKEQVKEIVSGVIELEKKTKKAEKTLSVNIGSEEINSALSKVVETEIKDLEKRTLTEEQQEALEEAKAEYKAGNYSKAIEILLLNR